MHFYKEKPMTETPRVPQPLAPSDEPKTFEQLTDRGPSAVMDLFRRSPELYERLYRDFQARVSNPRTVGGRVDVRRPR